MNETNLGTGHLIERKTLPVTAVVSHLSSGVLIVAAGLALTFLPLPKSYTETVDVNVAGLSGLRLLLGAITVLCGAAKLSSSPETLTERYISDELMAAAEKALEASRVEY